MTPGTRLLLDQVLERADAGVDLDADLVVELHRDGEIAAGEEPRLGIDHRRPAQTRPAVFGRSVTNMWPGLCVIMNGGFEASATACGVTPHAQNTGTSPGPNRLRSRPSPACRCP